MTAVVNLKHDPRSGAALDRRPEHDGAVRIDRRTPWGNPFRIGEHGTREQVVARYRTAHV